MHRQPAKWQCCNRLTNDSSDTPQGSTLRTGPCCDAGYSPPVVPCRALSHNGKYFQYSNKPAMSLPRRHICSGLLHMLKEGDALLLCICGLRASVKEHGEIDLHHIGCSVASHAESSAVQLQGASATSPSRGAAGPTCLFRTGGQYTVFRFFRLCGQMLQSLLLALGCSVCDNRHGQVAIVNASLFVPCCTLFAETWVFLLGFITLLSRFRHLICSALRKVTVKNFFNE